ncbi:MAG: DUF3168 domain-containing protein [Celeribacter sp.]|jgi:hypothetical protein
MKPAALQASLYQVLVGDSTLLSALSSAWGYDAVFSDVPQENADNNAFYPFVSFGPTVPTPWDDKDVDGGDERLQINVWSRSGDWIEAKQIAERIHALLHRTPLTISGAVHVTSGIESMDFSMDPDGETRRALIFLRVLYHDS